jgi:hypothetical protein
MEGDGMVYEGYRFVARTLLAGRPCGAQFELPVASSGGLTCRPSG